MVAPTQAAKFADLPGWEIVETGLNDIAAERLTPEACAVWIAFPRMLRAGLLDERMLARRIDDAELVLYRLLTAQVGEGDAYSRYNALLRRLVSFERAVDHRFGLVETSRALRASDS